GACAYASHRPSSDSAPETTDATSARRRKSDCSAGSSSVSTIRYAAARYAHRATASKPMTSAKGVLQPAANPLTTLPPAIRMAPDATAAAAVPKKNGATMLEPPNTTPHGDRGPTASRPCARKAKAAPRRTMPMSAIVIVTQKASPSAPNPTGKTVKSPVIIKINQTWLATQTGPTARA